ncbi:MFS transporter [Streptomyces sp. NA04227]|uniref:MFS transporter n=1 Tax=Streptomyces sp. NA04227 TaxID=2742136 RepID=UPI0015916ADC|nr:MFS transporter [Streptomyces sp. NA04227]QKW10183.1 MFS transporter [Streptomyces sp. NA04227]
MTDVTAAPSSPSTTKVTNRRRQLIAGTIGHLVEWFDWSAYAYLAIFFADQFFPRNSDSSLVPLLATFGVFAVGFLARPFGGLALGTFGDRYGRRAALTLSIALMGGGSLLIALTPTYDQIGVLAPVLLVVARLVQGLSTGGEWGAASAFMVESAPSHRRGLYSSFLYVGSNIGKIALTGAGGLLIATLGEQAMEDYGWRLLFGTGALLAVVGWWIRRGAEETSAQAGHIRTGGVERPGVFEFVRCYPVQTFQIFGIIVGPAVAFYTWTAYLPAYAVTSGGIDKGQALTAATVSLVGFAIAQPLVGMLSDRIGRKPLMLIYAVGFIVGTVPLLGAIGSVQSLILVQVTGLLLLSCSTAIAAAVMVEIFPARVRVSGISVPYSLSVAIFGGTTPMIATALQSAGHANWFGWYVVACTAVTLITVLTLRETHRAPLPE